MVSTPFLLLPFAFLLFTYLFAFALFSDFAFAFALVVLRACRVRVCVCGVGVHRVGVRICISVRIRCRRINVCRTCAAQFVRIVDDFLCQKVLDLGFVHRHRRVRLAQKLFARIGQKLRDFLTNSRSFQAFALRLFPFFLEV